MYLVRNSIVKRTISRGSLAPATSHSTEHYHGIDPAQPRPIAQASLHSLVVKITAHHRLSSLPSMNLNAHRYLATYSSASGSADKPATANSNNDRVEITDKDADALRKNALDDLAKCIQDSDLISAYRIANSLRLHKALRSETGSRTHLVIQDAKVTLALAHVIQAQSDWEECLPCLNLIIEMRQDLLGKSRSSSLHVASQDLSLDALSTIFDVVLSPHFGAMPSRRFAGTTALQMLSDYDVVLNRERPRARMIRAIGFASDIHALRRLLNKPTMQVLNLEEQYELALAYARCLQPQEAIDILAGLGDLSSDRKIETQLALCISFAEKSQFDKALENFEYLRTDKVLWTGESSMFDKSTTLLQTGVAIVYSSTLCVLPRLPFTNNLHSMGSTHCSPRFMPGYPRKIIDFYKSTVCELCKDDKSRKRSAKSINRLLFQTECLLYAMNKVTAVDMSAFSLSGLSKRLHSTQYDSAQSITLLMSKQDKHGLNRRALEAYSTAIASGPLCHFLWAMLFAKVSAGKRIGIVKTEIEHAIKSIPGYRPSVTELEPAILAFMPVSFWKAPMRGNFKDNSAFMVADELLAFLERSTVHPYWKNLLQMASDAYKMESTDHRLIPLCIWIARVQGLNDIAERFISEAISAPLVSVEPGSLALVNSRDNTFYEQMFSVLSTDRQWSNIAAVKLRAMMLQQSIPVYQTDRIAAALLYCCARSRNLPVARDVVSGLDAESEQMLSPRIKELFMRVCLRSGQVAKALSIFHHLNYDAYGNQIGEPSFVELVKYMGDIRGSVVGAEHAFDAWIQIMDHQGKVTRALVDKWQRVGLLRESRNKPNAFVPRDEKTVSQALESIGIERKKTGSKSNKQYLRTWEYHMVMALIGAYINTGCLEKALLWEKWILDAIRNKDISMKPELILSTAHVQRRHLMRNTWEDARACLDYVLAINKNIEVAAFRQDMYYLNQRPVFKLLTKAIRTDADGQMAAMVKAYLIENNAEYLWNAMH
ncbi:hypothetical protein GGI25_004924 [Coemansia spiralis]|uniref:Uncharacterized protein n=2 Tax=Coemansia TaxID=4863 RepID=A0A9W8FZI1_9FUNG|nr:hypothetical protein BX070DRAFT_228820 [Coemansia spiralis]KAJ1988639.1 hypothetical protein EDC05_005187 [Coemansia umbellata]KAJ2622427.1 hypothetical protein GGI26_003290 [Coemansia sp. RSA 1358]KAJ2672881.1 hypothetical protein GGI25_004924 [Coemansia spiralis]